MKNISELSARQAHTSAASPAASAPGAAAAALAQAPARTPADRAALVDDLTLKMIRFYQGNQEDIAHFLKVHAYAARIGRGEGLDPETQLLLEAEAVAHDIACPLCREKYGDTHGDHQMAESAELLSSFLAGTGLTPEERARVTWVVSRHHDYAHVDGPDYQMLLEADFLVNAGENPRKYLVPGYHHMKTVFFRTGTGLALLDAVFPDGADTVCG